MPERINITNYPYPLLFQSLSFLLFFIVELINERTSIGYKSSDIVPVTLCNNEYMISVGINSLPIRIIMKEPKLIA